MQSRIEAIKKLQRYHALVIQEQMIPLSEEPEEIEVLNRVQKERARLAREIIDQMTS